MYAYKNYKKCLTESLQRIPISPPVLPALDYTCAVLCEAVSKKGAERDRLVRSVKYTIDSDFSTDTYLVALPDTNNGNSKVKAVVVFRGTKLSSASNLKENYLIVRQKHTVSPLFVGAVKLTEDIVKKYGTDNVLLAGFSLGGARALFVSEILHIPAIVFNAAWSPFNIRHQNIIMNIDTTCSDSSPKIRAHIIVGDYISNSLLCHKSCTMKKILYLKTRYTTHMLNNFLAMKKEERKANDPKRNNNTKNKNNK